MSSLLTTLYFSCLKANSIAVACRQKPELLALLTQEKKDGEKNEKFDHDFKTLADVLIQEVVRYEISKLSSELGKNIYGEETNTFTNNLNQTVQLIINDYTENTRNLLEAVINGEKSVANILAEEVHSPFQVPQNINQQLEAVCQKDFVDLTKFGVWIDPIDGTSQYIKGIEKLDENGYPLKGLKVATVLIGLFAGETFKDTILGVYDRETGQPVMGVVGSPFTEDPDKRIILATCISSNFVLPKSIGDLSLQERSKPKIVIGSSESPEILKKLEAEFQVNNLTLSSSNLFVAKAKKIMVGQPDKVSYRADIQIIQAGGAGYKIMMVVHGIVDLYFNSTPSVFYWDTCGPHAILKALGGDILTFQGFQEIVYNDAKDKSEAAHTNGIVAFRDIKILDLFKSKVAVTEKVWI